MRMFFVAGIGIAIFIEFLLISKKNKSASDRILTLWMFIILVHLFLLYLLLTGDVFSYPFLLGLELPLPLVHGVFLFLYVSFLTKQLPDNRKILLLHLVPVTAMYLYLVPFFMLSSDQKAEVYRLHGAGYEFFSMVKLYAIRLSGIVYVAWSFVLLRKHRNNIREQYSDLEKVNLQWLQILTLGLAGIWFLVIFFGNQTVIMGSMVAFVFLVGFFGIRQAEIFTPNPLVADGSELKEKLSVPEAGEEATSDEPIAAGIERKKKYPKSGLTEELAGELHQALIRLMSEEALYKKSDLSINDLSTRLGVHPNYLSQVINQKERKNFYDFVNSYRLAEFKRLAAMPRNQQFTLLSLAYDCGFNSKSSFNRYFKEATGQTPSQYFATLKPSATES
jgi:AraC-like DNA-binding protein